MLSSDNPFIAAAEAGRHSWKRYAAVLGLVFLAIFAFMFAGSFVVALVMLLSGTISRLDASLFSPEAQFLLGMGVYVFVLAALLIGVRGLHQRRPLTLVTAAPRVRWRLIFQAAGLWLLLTLIGEGVSYLRAPGAYVWSFQAGPFFRFLFMALLLIPIQATTEELLFRGYLMQGIGRWTKRPWLALLITSVIFGLLHGANPEVSVYGPAVMFVYYIGFGLLAGLLTLLSGGAELAIGLHVVNNLYGALLVTFPSSALQTPALITMRQLDPYFMLAQWAIASLIFFGLCIVVPARRQR